LILLESHSKAIISHEFQSRRRGSGTPRQDANATAAAADTADTAAAAGAVRPSAGAPGEVEETLPDHLELNHMFRTDRERQK